MVSPMFIGGRLFQSRQRLLNSKQSNSVWQVEIPCTQNAACPERLALSTELRYAGKEHCWSLLQRTGKEVDRAFPRVSGIVGTISLFVVGILERVSRIGINLDLNFLSKLSESLLKFLDVIGSDAAILSAKNS